MSRLILICLTALWCSASAGLPTVNVGTEAVPKKINVGIVIFDGIFISEATIPFDVYKHVDPKKMDAFFVGETMAPVTSYYGTKMEPHYNFTNHPTIDVLVVPSGIGSHHEYLTKWYGGKMIGGNLVGKTAIPKAASVISYANNTALMNWVKKESKSAQIVTSHCWGAFTLAAAGVLDAKKVTTFPGYTDDLKASYPAIASVVTDAPFVIDGKIMTSNGGLVAFEACLNIVRHLFGDKVAQKIVSGLVYSDQNVAASKLQGYTASPAKPSGDAPPSLSGTDKLSVGILLMDGNFISEPIAPFDIFRHMGPSYSAFFVADSTTTAKTSHYGVKMHADYTYANAPKIDILVVPSGIGSHHSFLTKWYSGKMTNGKIVGKTTTGVDVTYYGNDTALIGWVKKTAKSAKWVTSHCWGAFTLADAGVLDGKTATTFPGYQKDLRDNYPAIGKVIDDTVAANKKYRIVQDGKLVTSNGGIAAYEAADYIIMKVYGEYYAKKVATGLVFAKDNYDAMANAYVVGTTGVAGNNTKVSAAQSHTSVGIISAMIAAVMAVGAQ